LVPTAQVNIASAHRCDPSLRSLVKWCDSTRWHESATTASARSSRPGSPKPGEVVRLHPAALRLRAQMRPGTSNPGEVVRLHPEVRIVTRFRPRLLPGYCPSDRDRHRSRRLSNQDMGDIGGGWQGAGCHLGWAPAEWIKGLAGLSARVAACLSLLRERDDVRKGNSGCSHVTSCANRRDYVATAWSSSGPSPCST
jgi:hypothetical protein